MIKYNVGCGKRNWGKDWVHVDGGNFDHLDSKDVFLMCALNDSIDLVYTSHLIGYFCSQEVVTLFGSWYNKLKPGGMLRIATPDFTVLSCLHQTGVPIERIDGPLHGRMVMGKQIIYHKYSWDFTALAGLLKDVGFTNVERYDHRNTEHPNTGDRNDFYDDHSASYINGTLISLNVECKRPL